MVVGGIPYYLDYVEPGLSPPQTVDAMFFAPNAPLRNEFRNLYAALFRHPELHLRLVQALGQRGGGLTQRELIAATVGWWLVHGLLWGGNQSVLGGFWFWGDRALGRWLVGLRCARG
jgi:hypothetical protein